MRPSHLERLRVVVAEGYEADGRILTRVEVVARRHPQAVVLRAAPLALERRAEAAQSAPCACAGAYVDVRQEDAVARRSADELADDHTVLIRDVPVCSARLRQGAQRCNAHQAASAQ